MINEANAIFGDATHSYTRATVPLGSFDVRSTALAKLNSGNGNFQTVIENSICFTATGVKSKVHTSPGYADYRGCNAELITPSGRIDLDKLEKAIGTNKGIDAANQRNFITALKTANTNDSHHAILLNMCQSYVNAVFKDHTRQTRDNIGANHYDAKGRAATYLNPGADGNPNRINLAAANDQTELLVKYYRDSHVIAGEVENAGSFGRTTVPLGPPNDTDPSGGDGDRPADYNPANIANADHSNVVYIEWLGPRANTFYYLHVGGRTDADDTWANYLYNVPGLAVNRFVFRWNAGTHNAEADYAAPDEVEWDNPDIIWAYIISYVKLNHLESTLANVHEIVCRTTFYPEAASAEGFSYRKAGLDIYIPEPAYFRGKFDHVLRGEPFGLNKVGIELSFLDQTTAMKDIIMGGLLNYTSLVGLWALYFEYSQHYNQLSVAYAQCIAQYPQLAQPHEQMAFAVGAVTGRDPNTMFEVGIGVTFNFYDYMEGMLTPYVRPSYDGANVDDFNIQGNQLDTVGTLHCPVSPCLLYGKLNGILTGTSHLAPSFEYNAMHPDQVLDFPTVLKLTNAMRLFGRDVTLKQTTGDQSEVTPWSPAHMVGIQPFSIDYSPDYNTQYLVVGSDQRENYGARVPGLIDMMHNGNISFSIDTRSIQFGMAMSGRHSAATVYRRNRSIPQINIKVSAGGMVNAKLAPMAPQNSAGPAQGPQDFGDDQQPQPEIPPAAVAVPPDEDQP